jgi:hypothetical protein
LTLGRNAWNILEFCIDPSRTLANSGVGKVLLPEIEKEKNRLKQIIEEKKSNPSGAQKGRGRRGGSPQEDEEERLKNFPQNFFAYFDSEEGWFWRPKEHLIEDEISDCMDGIHRVVN